MYRVTQVRIRNVRSIEALDLDLGRGFTVLIGENGSGKSTILECLELLRRAAEPGFMAAFYTIHRGLPGLLRAGATSMELGVVVEDDEGVEPKLDYSLSLQRETAVAKVAFEIIAIGPNAEFNEGNTHALTAQKLQDQLRVLRRPKRIEDHVMTPDVQERATAIESRIREAEQARDQLASRPVRVDMAWGAEPVLSRSDNRRVPKRILSALCDCLSSIEVQLGFDTRASWAARFHQRPESLRASTTHFPADRLSLLGFNLANAWSELRGRPDAHWRETMDLVRLGLGERVDSVTVSPDHGGGNVYLAVRFVDLGEPVYASNLSDGQLTWLGFVAMVRLNENRALLAIDEPELHLHPYLLAALIELLRQVRAPVMLATHSDRVLELLRPDELVDAVRVLSLDGSRTVADRLDPAELPAWLERFNDLGAIRQAGYLPRVTRPTEPSPP